MLADEKPGGATKAVILVVIRGLIYSSGLCKLLAKSRYSLPAELA